MPVDHIGGQEGSGRGGCHEGILPEGRLVPRLLADL